MVPYNVDRDVWQRSRYDMVDDRHNLDHVEVNDGVESHGGITFASDDVFFDGALLIIGMIQLVLCCLSSTGFQ